MNRLHKHTVGLAVGITVAILHAVWAVVMALSPRSAQALIDGNISIHSFSAPVQILPFTLGNAVTLVIVAFIAGYIVGSIFAITYNWVASQGK